MRHIELSEASAFGGELVEPGSLRDLAAVAGKIPEAEIVGVEKDKVGAGRRPRNFIRRAGQLNGGRQACDNESRQLPSHAKWCGCFALHCDG